MALSSISSPAAAQVPYLSQQRPIPSGESPGALPAGAPGGARSVTSSVGGNTGVQGAGQSGPITAQTVSSTSSVATQPQAARQQDTFEAKGATSAVSSVASALQATLAPEAASPVPDLSAPTA